MELQCRRRRRARAGAANRASVGLRVEAAIGGVVVFGLAGRTHLEARHRGLRPVVGNPAGNGEAWAAVGAVEKGIAVAAIGGSESSRRQSGQVAASAGMPVETWPRTSLATMRKPVTPVGSSSRTETESMRDKGGASERRRAREGCRGEAGGPSIFDSDAVCVVADEADEAFLGGRDGRRRDGNRRPARRRGRRRRGDAALRAVLVLEEFYPPTARLVSAPVPNSISLPTPSNFSSQCSNPEVAQIARFGSHWTLDSRQQQLWCGLPLQRFPL